MTPGRLLGQGAGIRRQTQETEGRGGKGSQMMTGCFIFDNDNMHIAPSQFSAMAQCIECIVKLVKLMRFVNFNKAPGSSA